MPLKLPKMPANPLAFLRLSWIFLVCLCLSCSSPHDTAQPAGHAADFRAAAPPRIVMSPSPAPANPFKLKWIMQEMNNWCWAASGQMAMQYLCTAPYGPCVSTPPVDFGQCKQVNAEYPHAYTSAAGGCCPAPTDPTDARYDACNQTGVPQKDYLKADFWPGAQKKYLSPEDLLEQIKNNQPIFTEYQVLNGNGTVGSYHIMVIIGFVPDGLGGGDVYIADPDKGGGIIWKPYTFYSKGDERHTHFMDYYGVSWKGR
jgi:hypothetical protein